MEYLQQEWQDPRFKGWYCIKCKKGSYDVQYPVTKIDETKRMNMQISLTQFPIVKNHATSTGHKLQGESLNALVTAQWSYGKKWVLAVLSRVRELSDLFFRGPNS